MQRYFVKEKNNENFILENSDIHHIKKVMRCKNNDKIEVVFSNNDDMAIGAIKAYENAGIELKDRPVIVGIDGIPEALNCIKDGAMKGTVYNNYIEQAKKVIDKCHELWSRGEEVERIRKYFKSSYEKITKENVDEYISVN